MSPRTALLGSSAATRELDEALTAAGRSGAKVLVTGESGVGKEVAARLVHERSPRAQQPLVTINCAGLPDSLLETELFGHVRGSFTGAYRDKPGLLHLAHGGTVFLDEVGEMSLRMQALLLRFLETGEIQQVGGDRPSERVDVRTVCATHRDLRASVREGVFREDLFYRLNVIHIHILPLRERPDDARDLFAHFIRAYASRHHAAEPAMGDGVVDLLTRYGWPGNVRELKNVAERLVVRSLRTIEISDLPLEVRIGAHPHDATPGVAQVQSDDGPAAVARRLIARMLQHRESFWDAVYEPFLLHDLTREHIRLVVGFGLEQTQGRYTAVTELFNMPKSDYKRFLNALRKYDCLIPYHAYRGGRPARETNDVSSEAQA